MSTQSANLDARLPMPPPIERNLVEPLIAVRDLFVHFNQGAKRELDPSRRNMRLVLALLGALVGCAALVILAIRFGMYPNGIWARILVTLILFVLALVVSRWLALLVLGKSVPRIVKAVDGVSLDIYAGALQISTRPSVSPA